MLAVFLPAEQARLMLPLIRRAPENKRLLLPDTSSGQVKSRVRKRFAEVKPLCICVENIDACIVRHSFLHAGESVKQKLVELLVFEIVVLDFSRRALIIHIVGRVGNHKISLFAVHKELVGFLLCAVTADKSVITEQPEVTGFCNERFFHLGAHIEIIVLGIGIIVKESSEFLFIKARQRKVKILRLQRFDFDFQHFLVPASVKSHSVIRDYVRFLLSRSKIIYKHTRHFGDVLGFRSENSSMTCYDVEIPVDDNGIDKAELTKRGTKLVQLFRRMGSGIVDVWYQLVNRDKLHFTGRIHLPFLLFKTLCKPFLASMMLPLTACPLMVRYCCAVRFGRLLLSSLKNSIVSLGIIIILSLNGGVSPLCRSNHRRQVRCSSP